MVGVVFKAKVGELEEEVREVFLRIMRKYFTGVFQGVSGNKRFLVRFQYGCKNHIKSNQLTIVIVEKIPVEEEPKVTTIPDIPDDTVPSEKGYYHGVYDMLHFNKYNSIYRKKEQADVDQYPD